MAPVPEQLAAPLPLAFTTATGLLLASLVACLVMARRWRRRHQPPSERASTDRALTCEERRSVAPYLRSGRSAPDPERARRTVAAARELRRGWENPWNQCGFLLYLTWLALTVGHMVWSGTASSGALGVFLPVLALLAVVFVVRRRRVLGRTRQSERANTALAALAKAPERPPGGDGLRKPY
ncbi:hypothetical protein [Nocardiopsis eucommiae]|uniref:hypothetical protein n=1 Tax=Nocardiopsis eucommiae TaxID=2831970 RepID=UPI003D71F42E